MMTTRPSKRPSVKDVSKWYQEYENTIVADWRGRDIWVMVEQGYPFPDFYRITYTIDGVRKTKLFYGETARNRTEMFVYDLGFRDVLGYIS